MILLLILHARQNLVVFENISIVRRKACCAPGVMLNIKKKKGKQASRYFNLNSNTYLSASSKMTILCRPGGKVTFFCANCLIFVRTTSIPLGCQVNTPANVSID